MRITHVLLLVPLLMSAVVAAQENQPRAAESLRVGGVVVDSASGQPIAGATVFVRELNRNARTDRSGGFLLEHVPAGTFTFTFSRLGYTPVAHVISLRDDAFLSVPLASQPEVLAGITVVATGFEARRRRTARASVQAMDEEYIGRSSHHDAFSLIRGHGSVQVSSCAGRETFSCIWFRGGYTAPAIYVDDQPFGGDLADLSAYSTEELYLVEVLRGNTGIRIFVTTRRHAELLARLGLRPKSYNAIEGAHVGRAGPIRRGLGRRP